jgi:hypothetical protein
LRLFSLWFHPSVASPPSIVTFCWDDSGLEIIVARLPLPLSPSMDGSISPLLGSLQFFMHALPRSSQVGEVSGLTFEALIDGGIFWVWFWP